MASYLNLLGYFKYYWFCYGSQLMTKIAESIFMVKTNVIFKINVRLAVVRLSTFWKIKQKACSCVRVTKLIR